MTSRTRAALVVLMAALAGGCSPPGAVNEKAVLDSTPHSEPAEYAKSAEAYDNHMIDRYTKGRPKAIDRLSRGRPKAKAKAPREGAR